MIKKTYCGRRDRHGRPIVRVLKDGDAFLLATRLDLMNASPTGFEWGYCGSGPAQLALAIMADATGDDRLALKVYQDFKFHVIAQLARLQPWRLSQLAVLEVTRTLIEARITHKREASR